MILKPRIQHLATTSAKKHFTMLIDFNQTENLMLLDKGLKRFRDHLLFIVVTETMLPKLAIM